MVSKNKITEYLTILLLIVTALQFSAWGITGEVYSVLRNIIIGLIIVLFLICFRNPIIYYRKIHVFRIHVVGSVILAFILAVFYFFSTQVDFDPLRDLTLALFVLMIGLNIKLTEKQFLRLNNIYILLFTFSALSIVYKYSSGFNIQDQYLPVPKNQIAPAFGVALIISLYLGIKKRGINKIFYFVLFPLSFASLLVLRGRAAIIAIFLSMLIFIFFFIQKRKYKIIFIVLASFLLAFASEYIYESLFLNYDLSDVNSITTGRFDRDLKGLEYFFTNPIGGQLINPIYKGQTIHNYFLFNLVNYGILFSCPLLIIYFNYILHIVTAIKRNSFKYFEIGPLAMLMLMVISLFEYTYPYAPGSAIFFPFFLMGHYYKKKLNSFKNAPKQHLHNI